MRMSEKRATHIAVSFIQIHSIITRGLRVSLENVQTLSRQAPRNEKAPAGLLNYIRALASVLNGHHLMEDELAFPYFQDKLPEAPFNVLTEWHQRMVLKLDAARAAVEKIAKDDQPEAALKDLENALVWLNNAWRPHINSETIEFINKADALVSVDEQLRLVKLFAEHSQKIAVPPYLTVPFVLFNLPAAERQVFSQGMPVEVLQNLVPVVWKEKWESMSPYLLA
jgi:hemerythrin-like domain-containing protein